MKPETMVEQLKQALGARLKSVLLYGSAVAGDFVHGASNFNLLVAIDPLGVAELDAIGPAIVAWTQAGNPPPLLFTPAQFAASTDSFPIEMSDIKQSRRVLFGDDLAAAIEVRAEDLRLQLEMELAGKLLALRSRYATLPHKNESDKPEVVGELMLRSLPTFLVLLRATLRLFQPNVPDKKLDALLELARHLSFDPQPFVRLSELRHTHAPAKDVLSTVSFATYLNAIETVASAVDRADLQKANQA